MAAILVPKLEKQLMVSLPQCTYGLIQEGFSRIKNKPYHYIGRSVDYRGPDFRDVRILGVVQGSLQDSMQGLSMFSDTLLAMTGNRPTIDGIVHSLKHEGFFGALDTTDYGVVAEHTRRDGKYLEYVPSFVANIFINEDDMLGWQLKNSKTIIDPQQVDMSLQEHRGDGWQKIE